MIMAERVVCQQRNARRRPNKFIIKHLIIKQNMKLHNFRRHSFLSSIELQIIGISQQYLVFMYKSYIK